MDDEPIATCLFCSGRNDVRLEWSAEVFGEVWERVRQELGRRRVSGPVLGRACGVTGDTIFNWRKGVGEPSGTQVMALARVLDVSPFAFFRRRPLVNESGGPPAREAAVVAEPTARAGR